MQHKKNKKFTLNIAILMLLAISLIVACNSNPAPEKQEDEDKLDEQLQSLEKSIDEIDEAMNQATVLNDKIQLVEEQVEKGELSRERADQMIHSLNERYGKSKEVEGDDFEADFPQWALNIGLSEPAGMNFDDKNSFQTKESKPEDGYNSILFVYQGNYGVALREAGSIADKAGIPMTEQYKKAQELSERLGKEIEGVKGIAYMNYNFGESNLSQKYKISIGVDEYGKLTITAVDIQKKNERVSYDYER